MQPETSRSGVHSFFIIWLGQLISLVGSQLTGFAMGVWVYDQTRSVFLLALTQIANQAPYVLLSPIAGVLADRWNRRTAMIVSDFGAGLAVLTAALLYNTHTLQAWMVIPIILWMSAFNTLMWPAYTASITLLIPKEHFGRANGLIQLGEALPQIAGPAIAGVLYVSIHLGNMALIDFATYLISVILMMAFVSIPATPASANPQAQKTSMWQEMKFGWNYITARRELVALLSFFVALNFASGVMQPLLVPMILESWNAQILGYLSTIMGIGMVAGTLVVTIWGGGRKKVITLLVANAAAGLFLMAVCLRQSIPLLAVCGFGAMFMGPLMNAASQSIWQVKVEAGVQGRVFAVRRGISWSSGIIAPLLASPLADGFFKPAMSAGGVLAPVLGPLIGTGAGRGIALLISLVGLTELLISVGFSKNTRLRHIEDDQVAS
jgi:MFS transporter, DHA3 family, macrolide efflux protein